MAESVQIMEEIDALLLDSEIELVDVRTERSSRGLIVRVFVDKPGGISIDDCSRLSRAVGDHFEAENTIPGGYVLEVSSPGVDRPLRLPRDLERFRGESILVSTYEKVEGNYNHRGVLDGFDDEAQAVLITDAAGRSQAIPLGAIRKANLERDPWPKRPDSNGSGRSGRKR